MTSEVTIDFLPSARTNSPAQRRRSWVITHGGNIAFVLSLAFVSGAAGLAHQMIWTRRLVDLLGASPITFSKVIGAFFLGLAAGAMISTRRSQKNISPWMTLACVELCIALLALPVVLAPNLAELLGERTVWRMVIQMFSPFLFVMPPAIAMGMVVPCLIGVLKNCKVTTATLLLYALNTVGGVAGIAGILLFALPNWGLTVSALMVCGINLCLAVAAALRWCVDKTESRSARRSFIDSSLPSAEVVRGDAHAFSINCLAFFSGFLVLALEVVLQHQFAQVTINSLFSSATVLAWVLVSLAIGAALVPVLARFIPNTASLKTVALLGASVICALQPILLMKVRPGLSIVPYELPPGTYMGEVSKLGLIAVAPLLVAVGLLFPILLREATTASPNEAPRRAARLLAWSGLGGWFGSECAQHLIAPAFGLWQSITVIGVFYWLAAALTLMPKLITHCRLRPNRQSVFSVGSLAFVALILCAAALKSHSLPQASLKSGERLAALSVGREGVVATVECGPGDWRMLFNNSYTLGGSKAQSNQERQAHLPILLHGHAKSVALLGVATGSTTAGAALHPSLERIDAAELSPLVLDQARTFFAPFNRDVFQDPRVSLFAEDARCMMSNQRAAYDVVIGDLFLPWRTGEGRLFSLEHFQAVRSSLKADGVYCQWLPLFQLTRDQFDVIVRTFQQVFPDVLLVRGDFYTELPILGLMGGRTLAQLDWKQIAGRCSKLRLDGKTTDPLVRHAEGVAMMLIGPLPSHGVGPINTLANSWLEWDSGENILGLAMPWFTGVPAAEFVRDIQRTSVSRIPSNLRAAHDAGQFFLTAEIAAKLKLPAVQDFISQIPQRIPAALREDRLANWQEWPMRLKPQLKVEIAKSAASTSTDLLLP